MKKIRVLAVGVVAVVVFSATAASAKPRPGAAAKCANDIATVLDMEAVYAPAAEVDAYIEGMSYKCLSIGARAEEMVAEGYGVPDVMTMVVRRVTRAYHTTRAAVSAAFCEQYGCA